MTDTYSLINLAREGDKTAEKKLVDDNLLLVHSCVRKLMHHDYANNMVDMAQFVDFDPAEYGIREKVSFRV